MPTKLSTWTQYLAAVGSPQPMSLHKPSKWQRLQMLLRLQVMMSCYLSSTEGSTKRMTEEMAMGGLSGLGGPHVSVTKLSPSMPDPIQADCVSLEDSVPLVLQADGDVVIGGMFPVHYLATQPENFYSSQPQNTQCSGCAHHLPSFDHRAFRWMMTMAFAVEEINRDSRLLPGVRLGYRILDSCDHVHTSLRAAHSLVTPHQRGAAGTSNVKTAPETEPLCLAGAPIPAVIGLASSSPTRAVAHTLGPFRIPVVSYFATCTCLTDKRVYPSFLRTVPSDLFQVRGLVQLVTHFGWRWVGTLGTEDDYSRYGIQAFSQQLKEQNGCVAFHLTIPKSPSASDIGALADTLQSSRARVVVAFATEGQLFELFSKLSQRNVTGIQWVASEAWVTARLLTSPQFQPLLGGTLGFAFPGVHLPGLAEFLLAVRPSPHPGSEFVNMFWEELFGCRLGFGQDGTTSNITVTGTTNLNGVCTGAEDLRETQSSYTDVYQVRISYNVYKAVHAIAHALHQVMQCGSVGDRSGVGSCKTNTSYTPGELLNYLKRVNFTDQFGEKVNFDLNGEPVPLYDIINWQKDFSGKIRFIKVGSYDGSAPLGHQLQIKESLVEWTKGQSQVPVSLCTAPCPPGTRQAARKGEPPCCFDCVHCADGEISNQTDSMECTKCPDYYWSDRNRVRCVAGVDDFLSYYDTMGVILVTLTFIGVVTTTIITAVFHRFRTTPIVRANNSELSFLLLLSLKLCFLCSLVFIGQPSVWSCKFRQAAFGISFVLCLSCLLVKTIVVLSAFRATIPSSSVLKLFGPSQQRSLIFCTTAPQVCLCAGWLSTAPPYPFRNPFYQGATGKILLECKEPWPTGFYLVLGYIGLLAVICLLLAFLGRKLPDTFNEAKLITFSMLIFCAVWLSFIPAYVSSPGKFTVAVEIFAILASSFGLLLFIFVPKCYIILLRPERNTKKRMTGKTSK